MSTFDLCYAANWWNVHELVNKPLPIYLGKDSSLIIISQSSAHSFIIHVRFVLVKTPKFGHGLAIHQLEHPLLPVAPLDELGTAVFILEQRWYRK